MKKVLFCLLCLLSIAPPNHLHGSAVLAAIGIVEPSKDPTSEFQEAIRKIPLLDGLSIMMEPTGKVDLTLMRMPPQKCNNVLGKLEYGSILCSVFDGDPVKDTNWLGINQYYTLDELKEAFTIVTDLAAVGDIRILSKLKCLLTYPLVNPSKAEPLHSFQIKRFQLWDELWRLRLDYIYNGITDAVYQEKLNAIETEMTAFFATVADAFPVPATRRLSDESTLSGGSAETDVSDAALSTSDVTPLIPVDMHAKKTN